MLSTPTLARCPNDAMQDNKKLLSCCGQLTGTIKGQFCQVALYQNLSFRSHKSTNEDDWFRTWIEPLVSEPGIPLHVLERWIREAGKVNRHLFEKILSRSFETESASALRMAIAVVKIRKTSPEKNVGENFVSLATKILERSLSDFDEKVRNCFFIGLAKGGFGLLGRSDGLVVATVVLGHKGFGFSSFFHNYWDFISQREGKSTLGAADISMYQLVGAYPRLGAFSLFVLKTTLHIFLPLAFAGKFHGNLPMSF